MRAMSEACFGIVAISLNNDDNHNTNQRITPFSKLSGEMLLEMLKKEKNNTTVTDDKHSLCNEKKDSSNDDDEFEENGSINSPLSE